MQKTSNYARRLCDLPVTEDMVQDMRNVFVENPLMQAALMDPTVAQKEKEGIINRLFPQEFRAFLADLAAKDGIGKISEICDEFLKLRDERNQKIKAVLTCVNEPAQEQLEKIRKFIKTKYNCNEVEIENREGCFPDRRFQTAGKRSELRLEFKRPYERAAAVHEQKGPFADCR